MKDGKSTVKKLLALLLVLCPVLLYAHGITVYDHTKIKERSTFRIMGEIDLRTEKDTAALPKYRTLNHEFGMKVDVLEIVKADDYENQHGLWLWVLLAAPMWADNGEWLEKYQKFMIFLPDETPLFDFEDD